MFPIPKRLFTSRPGGVRPYPGGNRPLLPFRILPAPPKLWISTLQRKNQLANPLVRIGESVSKGQLIGQGETPPVRIHAPAAGTVIAIDKQMDRDGAWFERIVLERENSPPGEPAPKQDWRRLRPEEILLRIQEAGVVGLGGAMFPSGEKLRGQIGRPCDYLLVNAAESEAYLQSDAALIARMGLDLIGGIDILAHCLRPRQIVVGLKHADRLYPLLRKAIAEYRKQLTAEEGGSSQLPPVRIARLRNRYPQGAERQLIQALSGRRISAGQLPADVSCSVFNAGTVKAVYDAAAFKIPLTERAVTVSGSAVARPGVFWAPIGTPLPALLEAAGGFRRPPARMIEGGPMMGTPFFSLEQYLTQRTSGFLFLEESEIRSGPTMPCIRCGACLQVCPARLDPARLFARIEIEDFGGAERSGLPHCIECGACSAVCPSRIPLVQSFRTGKRRLQIERDKLSEFQ